MLRRSLALGMALWLVHPAAALNETGHKAVARIAYENLTERARQAIDALLREHPDYDRWIAGAVDDEGLVAFMEASVWPDTIKGDHRFHEGDGSDADTLPGFPDMERHRNWHFLNRPFNPQNVPIPPLPAENAQVKIKEFVAALGSAQAPDEVKTFQLPWLIHLVGDVHQPLHCSTRYLKTQRRDGNGKFVGDKGGNEVHIEGVGENLHSYWDGVVGGGTSDNFIRTLAASITKSHPADARRNAGPDVWIDESFQLVRNSVYGFQGAGTRRDPAVLKQAYRREARRVGRQRVALAGYRLAAVLNQAFP